MRRLLTWLGGLCLPRRSYSRRSSSCARSTRAANRRSAYGTDPDPREFYGVRLGVLAPRGERSGLIVGMDQLLRLTCNPLFPYVERRLREWIEAGVSKR